MVLKKIRGFLTNDDVELLEKASTKEPKYKKSVVHTWLCNSCNYHWFYKCIKCPVCSSKEVKEKTNSTA